MALTLIGVQRTDINDLDFDSCNATYTDTNYLELQTATCRYKIPTCARFLISLQYVAMTTATDGAPWTMTTDMGTSSMVHHTAVHNLHLYPW